MRRVSHPFFMYCIHYLGMPVCFALLLTYDIHDITVHVCIFRMAAGMVACLIAWLVRTQSSVMP